MTMRESGDGDRIDESVIARPVPDIIKDVLVEKYDLDVFEVHAQATNATWTDDWMLEGEATVFYNDDDTAESVACEFEFKPRHADGAYDLSRLSVVLWLPEGTVYPLEKGEDS